MLTEQEYEELRDLSVPELIGKIEQLKEDNIHLKKILAELFKAKEETK